MCKCNVLHLQKFSKSNCAWPLPLVWIEIKGKHWCIYAYRKAICDYLFYGNSNFFPYLSQFATYLLSKCALQLPLEWTKVKGKHADQMLINNFQFNSNSIVFPICYHFLDICSWNVKKKEKRVKLYHCNQTGSHEWAFNWHIYIWPRPILKVKVMHISTSTVNILKMVIDKCYYFFYEI